MSAGEWIANRPEETLPIVDEVTAIRLGFEKYPEYTRRNPNPATGKPDCALEKRFKDAARHAYIKRLLHASA